MTLAVLKRITSITFPRLYGAYAFSQMAAPARKSSFLKASHGRLARLSTPNRSESVCEDFAMKPDGRVIHWRSSYVADLD